MVITNKKSTTDTQKPKRRNPSILQKKLKPQQQKQKEEMNREELPKKEIYKQIGNI